MGDRQPHQLQVHAQRPFEGGMKTLLPQRGPTASQVLAVLTLLPFGGTLLALSGLTFVGSLTGLAVSTPLFILFSPIIIPATVTIGLAIAAFLASGAFSMSGLSSLSSFYNYIRQATSKMPDRLDQAKKQMQEMAGQVGQKTRELGQTAPGKGQEGGRT